MPGTTTPRGRRPKSSGRVKAGQLKPQVRFLVTFLALVAVAFGLIALKPVNDAIVDPYTAFIARSAGAILRVFGEDLTVRGCLLTSPRFSVSIFNGCNGLITTLILVAGVLAFPATWRAKLIGVVGGIFGVQVINMIRIVSLYYIGVFFPKYFNDAHVVVWQTIVILAGIALWVSWANFVAIPHEHR